MTLRAALAPLLLFLTTCAAPASQAQKPPEGARPALWKVSDADTTLYLFGTIHVLPQGYEWQTPAFRQLMARADGLVVETVVSGGPTELARVMGDIGMSPGLPPLLDRVPADKRARLSELIARTGLPPSYFDRIETWAAAVVLVSVTLPDLGLEGGRGVEAEVQDAFTAAGKPILGLESPAEQLGYLDRLPEADQREFLAALLEERGAMRKDFEAMLGAWARGEEKAIAATFDDEAEVTPAVRDALLVQRNRAWARWIEKRMAQPGTLLIAVGAGHLAGADSVNALLAKSGLKVARVQ
jgi:uncharacterized protein YbaP (TraB family)